MALPWLKKNPFMSMWLSTAHRAAGALRGQVTAQATRQVKTAVTEATQQNLRLWSEALKPPPARPKRKR